MPRLIQIDANQDTQGDVEKLVAACGFFSTQSGGFKTKIRVDDPGEKDIWGEGVKCKYCWEQKRTS